MKKDEIDLLYEAAATYLESIGARPVVMGGTALMHQPGDRPYNHSLVIHFTGQGPVDFKKQAGEVSDLAFDEDMFALFQQAPKSAKKKPRTSKKR